MLCCSFMELVCKISWNPIFYFARVLSGVEYVSYSYRMVFFFDRIDDFIIGGYDVAIFNFSVLQQPFLGSDFGISDEYVGGNNNILDNFFS